MMFGRDAIDAAILARRLRDSPRRAPILRARRRCHLRRPPCATRVRTDQDLVGDAKPTGGVSLRIGSGGSSPKPGRSPGEGHPARCVVRLVTVGRGGSWRARSTACGRHSERSRMPIARRLSTCRPRLDSFESWRRYERRGDERWSPAATAPRPVLPPEVDEKRGTVNGRGLCLLGQLEHLPRDAAPRGGEGMRDRMPATGVRIHFDNLLRLAHADRPLRKAFAAGSIPPEMRGLWNRMEARGVEVALFDRGQPDRGEQEMPDRLLQLRMLEDALDFNGTPGIVTLLTGDGAGYPRRRRVPPDAGADAPATLASGDPVVAAFVQPADAALGGGKRRVRRARRLLRVHHLPGAIEARLPARDGPPRGPVGSHAAADGVDHLPWIDHRRAAVRIRPHSCRHSNPQTTQLCHGCRRRESYGTSSSGSQCDAADPAEGAKWCYYSSLRTLWPHDTALRLPCAVRARLHLLSSMG